MTVRRILLAAAVCTTPLAAAGAQPFGYPSYPTYRPPPAPQSWSYDPYTSGAAPCPQGVRGDLQTCAQKMPPTYGLPGYRPQR